MQLCLGLFVFSLDTLSYQELQRRTSWKHPTQARVGARDASQFLGAGEDIITLNGSMVPEFAGKPASLDELRRMANTGQAWALVEGSGAIYGAYVVTELQETRSFLHADGSARKIEFGLTLRRVDEDDEDAGSGMGELDSTYALGMN